MLIVTFAGCGSEETPEPEAPAEIELPEEAPEENEAVHWSADEWVINGISVFSGSESIDAIAAILGAEPRYSAQIIEGISHPTTFLDADTILPPRGEMAIFSHNHNMFRDIQTARSGVILMRGITVGETSIDEVIAMFPKNNEYPPYDFYDLEESGDGAYRWTAWPTDEDGLLSINFYRWGEDHAQYSIGFLDGVARIVWFTQRLHLREEASPFPTSELTSPTDEPALESDDSSFLLGRWNCDDQFYPEFFFLPGDYVIYHEAFGVFEGRYEIVDNQIRIRFYAYPDTDWTFSFDGDVLTMILEHSGHSWSHELTRDPNFDPFNFAPAQLPILTREGPAGR